MVATDFVTNHISFTFDPKADIMLGTTFVKVARWSDKAWDCSAASWTCSGTWPKRMPKISQRAPTIDVSMVDLTAEIEERDHLVEICAEIERRSEDDMEGFLSSLMRHWFPPTSRPTPSLSLLIPSWHHAKHHLREGCRLG